MTEGTLSFITACLTITAIPYIIKYVFVPNASSIIFSTNPLHSLITEEYLIANRFTFTITAYNYKDFMLVNVDKLKSQNYLVDIEKTNSYLFNEKVKIVITEAHKELPSSRTKDECYKALLKEYDLTDLKCQYTDKNNETAYMYLVRSNSVEKELI